MSILYIRGCLPAPELEGVTLGPGDELWTLNNQAAYPSPIPATRHFSLHSLSHEEGRHGREYLEWLSRLEIPVYLCEKEIGKWDWFTRGHLPRPRRATPLPSLLGGRQYFTGSFAYMLAFVLQEALFEEVHLVGVKFSDECLWKSRKKAAEWLEGEWWGAGDAVEARQVIDDLLGQGSGDESWARECILYWCGRLEQAGVRVIVPEDSWLFHNKWLETHCKHREDPLPECGLYGLCECLGG